MKNLLRAFLIEDRGATAIEYGLIAVVLSLGILVGVGNAADAIQWLWSDNNSRIANVFR